MAQTFLDDVRVVELAQYQALPRGGLLLRDFGAEVIKVEPLVGAPLRHSGPFVHGVGVQFAAHNRDKKSVTLDLRSDEGKAALDDLLRCSDVLLENFRPGVLEDMGYTAEVLRRLNPTLIVCRVSGFGQQGPHRDWGSYDPIGQAMSGLAHQTGREFGHPVLAQAPVVDRLTAIHAAAGVLAALRHRDRTGRGQVIDLAMLDVGISLMEVPLTLAHFTGEDEYLRGGTFIECADGWVIAGPARRVMWQRLLEIMGFDDLARDSDFTAPMWTSPQSSERLELFQLWSKDRSMAEVVGTLQENRVPCAPVYSIAEVLRDPQIEERGTMAEVPVDDEGRSMLVSSSPIKMSEESTAIQEVPRLGQHNAEVLTELLGRGDGTVPESPGVE